MFIPVCIFLAARSAAVSCLYGGERELTLVRPPYKQLTMPQGQENTNGVFYVFVQALQPLKICMTSIVLKNDAFGERGINKKIPAAGIKSHTTRKHPCGR